MFFKPSRCVRATGNCLQISTLQVFYQFFHKFPCDTLSSERSIDKSVVDVYRSFLAVCIGECNLREQISVFIEEYNFIFFVCEFHFYLFLSSLFFGNWQPDHGAELLRSSSSGIAQIDFVVHPLPGKICFISLFFEKGFYFFYCLRFVIVTSYMHTLYA